MNRLLGSRTAMLAVTIAVVVACGAQALNAAELRLSRFFTSDMVLQRGKPIAIKGFADKGSTVTVKFSGQEKTAKADDNGQWSVILDPMQASAKPESLVVVSSVGNLKSEISNVLVGDVILFARQTSIDISLGRDDAGRKAAAADSARRGFTTRSTGKGSPAGGSNSQPAAAMPKPPSSLSRWRAASLSPQKLT